MELCRTDQKISGSFSVDPEQTGNHSGIIVTVLRLRYSKTALSRLLWRNVYPDPFAPFLSRPSLCSRRPLCPLPGWFLARDVGAINFLIYQTEVEPSS